MLCDSLRAVGYEEDKGAALSLDSQVPRGRRLFERLCLSNNDGVRRTPRTSGEFLFHGCLLKGSASDILLPTYFCFQYFPPLFHGRGRIFPCCV